MELTWIPASLRVFAWLMLALALYALYAALTKPKTLTGKAIWSLAVVAASALVLFGPRLADLSQRDKAEAAMAHFEMRCKSAGEKIDRTVENVDGVVWIKWRDKSINFGDQFKLDDPYGRLCGAEDCIASLLIDDRMVPIGNGGSLAPSNKRLYRYVEAVDPADGRLYRFTKSSAQGSLEKRAITVSTASYGVLWADVSTREDRERWVAGGSLKVIDLQTKKVIAERIGYLIDRGQGDRSGARSPWPWASRFGPACPSIADHNVTFISKVLKPNQGE
jgi:hypothetical protein